MSGHKRIPTSAEVWAIIKVSHPNLKVFSSYSAPDGDLFGNPTKGMMLTEFGFENCDFPIIGAETTWDINPEKSYERLNEKHIYWLCVAIED